MTRLHSFFRRKAVAVANGSPHAAFRLKPEATLTLRDSTQPEATLTLRDCTEPEATGLIQRKRGFRLQAEGCGCRQMDRLTQSSG